MKDLRHRIGTNDSVDQIFLFLRYNILYHVYVHDPRFLRITFSFQKNFCTKNQQIESCWQKRQEDSLPKNPLFLQDHYQILLGQLQPPWSSHSPEVNQSQPIFQPLPSTFSSQALFYSYNIKFKCIF